MPMQRQRLAQTGGVKMPTVKIKKPEPYCNHPEHNPPSHRVFEPGTYEHTCPACGKKIIFEVPQIIF